MTERNKIVERNWKYLHRSYLSSIGFCLRQAGIMQIIIIVCVHILYTLQCKIIL